MQMENVQLHALHRVNLARERGKRIEVPRDIDHDAAPHETRSVIDYHRWDGEASRHVGDGLSERRQATQDARRSISCQHDGIIFDGQRVTLTRIDRQRALVFPSTVDPKLRSTGATDIETSSSCDVVLKPQHRPVEHGVAIAQPFDLEAPLHV